MDFKACLDNLNEEITCAICKETYGEPKLLPCLHTICVDCLNTMAQRAIQGNRAAIICPLCKVNIQIPQPEGNFNSLPNNIYINRLKEIVAVREAENQDSTCGNCRVQAKQASFCFDSCKVCCTKCWVGHLMVQEFEGHRVLALRDVVETQLQVLLQPTAFCQQPHNEEFVMYYCIDCKDFICQVCATLEHKTHRFQLMQEVAQEYQADIAEQVKYAKDRLQEYQRGTEKVRERKSLVQENLEAVKADIHNTVEMIHATLQRQEDELVAQIEKLAVTSQDQLDTQHDNITSQMDIMQQAIECAEGLVKRKRTLEIIATKPSLDERFGCLKKTKVEIHPEVAVEGSFVLNEAITTLQLGYIKNTVEPRKCTFELDENLAKNIFAKAKSSFLIITRNQFGQACYNPEMKISVTVTPPQYGHVVVPSVQVSDNLNGEYSASFTPEVAGEHDVSVKVGGSEASGSPFAIQTRSREFVPVKVIGMKGQGNGEFLGPRSVAINLLLNELAVTDRDNCRIQIFDKDGNYLRQFGQRGRGRGQFLQPVGIVFDNDNNIIVSDYTSHIVSVFTKDGVFLRNLATKGKKDGQVTGPCALTITDEGNVIVADTGNKRIQVFSPDGKVLHKFGDTRNEMQLLRPKACVYHGDHYMVTDPDDRCVKLYDRRGQYVRRFGVPDDNKGASFKPNSIVGSKCGNVIVTDVGNHRLVMFNPDGGVIATFGTEGTGLGQFNYPADVSVLNDTVIVCDIFNNRLKVVKYP